MKSIILAILLMVSIVARSQDENYQKSDNDEYRTIFGPGSSNGGYGSFSVGYTTVNGRDAAIFGGRGAWIINHGFALGMGGEGFVSDYRMDDTLNAMANFSGGYGGLIIEPIVFPKFPVHLSFPILLGAGGMAYARRIDNNNNLNNDNWSNNSNGNLIEESEVFFVAEPGVEIELNMTRFLRVAFGGSYRLTTRLNMNSAKPDALNSFTAKVSFKFGRF